MPQIRLTNSEWFYDEAARLGAPGGFGEVFRGRGAAGEVAVKRLMISAEAAAHRELNIGEKLASRTLEHVVPVLDSGQDAQSDRYFLVMPICDGSLQEEIRAAKKLSAQQAIEIGRQIVSGLMEVDEIVHRDLKPGNVLKLDGRWCLADFGIAKFVEDSTSMQTLRSSLTPAYGAPEQWRNERPTHATDVYALGCIFYTMVSGTPVFSGSAEEIREKHLHEKPANIDLGDLRLNSFVAQMLRKSPASRPTLERCLSMFATGPNQHNYRNNPYLQSASAKIAEESAINEARKAKLEAKAQERKNLADEGINLLNELIKQLFSFISNASPEAKVKMRLPSLIGVGASQRATMGDARLDFDGPYFCDVTAEGWDICSYATISVTCNAPVASHIGTHFYHQIEGSSRLINPNEYKYESTLCFCSVPKDRSFRWREINFWNLSDLGTCCPFGFDPSSTDFTRVVSTTMTLIQIAFGPAPVDAEDSETFFDRWLTLFGKAAQGKLTRPDRLPLQASFFS